MFQSPPPKVIKLIIPGYKMLRLAVFVVIGQTAASLLPAIFPKPTPSSDNYLDAYGWSPKPTNALLQPPTELKKRQGTADTCGYISGNGLQPLTCSAGLQCVVNTVVKAAGCCVDTSCTLFTACIPKVSSKSGVTYNNRVGLCNQGSFTQCQTKAYNYGAAGILSEYNCGVTPTYIVVSTTSTFTTPPTTVTSTKPITTTSILTKDGTVATSVQISVISVTDPAIPTSNAPQVTKTLIVNTQPEITITATSTGTAAPPGFAGVAGTTATGSAAIIGMFPTAGSAAASPTTTAITSSSTSKPFPVGAAVGGAVGGLAVIGAAIAGIIFLCLRSKRKDKNISGRGGVDNMAEYTGPTGATPVSQAAAQQAYYPPQSPPPGGAYQPPQGYRQPIYQQQGPPQGPHSRNQAELAAFPQQNDPSKGFNQPETRSFSPPLSPAPPYPPSPYNSSPPLGNAVELDPGRPVRRSKLY